MLDYVNMRALPTLACTLWISLPARCYMNDVPSCVNKYVLSAIQIYYASRIKRLLKMAWVIWVISALAILMMG